MVAALAVVVSAGPYEVGQTLKTSADDDCGSGDACGVSGDGHDGSGKAEGGAETFKILVVKPVKE